MIKGKFSQKEFGMLIGITQPAVAELINKGIIKKGSAGKAWLKSYCKHLREQAAGRTGGLAHERTRESKERADGLALKNKIEREEYAPISIITEALASVGSQIAGILETIPVRLKRQAKLKTSQIQIIEKEIVKVRNIAAAVKPNWKTIKINEDVE